MRTIGERFHDTEKSKLATCATLLEPRFKDKCFLKNLENRLKATQSLLDELKKLEPIESSVQTQENNSSDTIQLTSKRPKLDGMIWKFVAEQNGLETVLNQTHETKVSVKLDNYLKFAQIDEKIEGPLEWWLSKQTEYPYLFRVVKQTNRISLNI